MEDKDTVASFVEQRLDFASQQEFVQLRELYSEYNSMYALQQRDKKMHKNQAMFQAGLLRIFPDARYKKQHKYRDTEGRCRTACSVLLGYKRKREV